MHPAGPLSTHGARLWAVVPVKQTKHAKQRLAGVLSSRLRQQLALAMLEDVLAALCASRRLAGIAIATVDEAACEIGARYGARIMTDGATDGYTYAVTKAVDQLAADGAAGCVVVPGDVPLATPHEIAQLVAKHAQAPAFTIVPAHDRCGSNAVACSPPRAVRLRFGEHSFVAHLRAAEQAGIRPTILPLSGMGLDIDEPQDLAAFAARPSPTRTWAFLNRCGYSRQNPAVAAAGSA